MSARIKINSPEFVIVSVYGGFFMTDGHHVVRRVYKLGLFNYIRKVDRTVMVFDDPVVAEVFCNKLNEAQSICPEL